MSFDKADANRDGVIEQQEAISIANRDFAFRRTRAAQSSYYGWLPIP